MALGDQHIDVLRLILWQGGQLALAGLMVGIVSAFMLNRLAASMLYDTRTDDPPTFIAASLVLAVTALAACFLPARKATCVDPMKVLRAE
jgi:putative ABC transport system permease protein